MLYLLLYSHPTDRIVNFVFVEKRKNKKKERKLGNIIFVSFRHNRPSNIYSRIEVVPFITHLSLYLDHNNLCGENKTTLITVESYSIVAIFKKELNGGRKSRKWHTLSVKSSSAKSDKFLPTKIFTDELFLPTNIFCRRKFQNFIILL